MVITIGEYLPTWCREKADDCVDNEEAREFFLNLAEELENEKGDEYE